MNQIAYWYIKSKRGLIWIVYIAPLASLASLARSLRSPNGGSTVWNLLESEKPYKTNETQQLRSPDRLSIPIIYLLIVFWASWKRRLGAILGRLSTILGRPGAILGRLGAILSSLDAVLGSSWPPKNLTRSFQITSQDIKKPLWLEFGASEALLVRRFPLFL